MKINLDYTVSETCRDFCIAASITAKLCNQYTCTVQYPLHVMSSADTLNSTHLNPIPFPPSARPRTPARSLIPRPLFPTLPGPRRVAPPGPGLGLRNAGQPGLHRPHQLGIAVAGLRPVWRRKSPGRASIAAAGLLGLRHDRRQRPDAAGR